MNLKKIKIILFLPLALFFIASFFCFPTSVKAEVNASMPTFIMPNLEVDFSGLNKIFSESKPTACPDDKSKLCINWIGEYISGIYKYAIGIVGILAAIILMVAGVIWLTAGGNASQITEAKAWITASLTGLVIALCSYTILYQVNPDLLALKPLKITSVAKINTPISSIATRSGLDICTLRGDQGVKLKATKSGVTTTSIFPNWMDSFIDNAFNYIVTGNVAELKICQYYCDTMQSEKDNGNPVKRFELIKNSDAVCCVCNGPMKYNRNTLMANIIIKYDFDYSDKAKVLNDASDDLLSFLDCMANQSNLQSKQKNKISSIGDINCAGDLKNCLNKQHSSNSCHYSNGAGIYKSYAVDIGNGGEDVSNPINNNIKTAAQNCKAKFIHKESNHIHISINPCLRDGTGANF
ncbi:MAG: pilin [bacterium]|nr:pilin [bacterium]